MVGLFVYNAVNDHKNQQTHNRIIHPLIIHRNWKLKALAEFLWISLETQFPRNSISRFSPHCLGSIESSAFLPKSVQEIIKQPLCAKLVLRTKKENQGSTNTKAHIFIYKYLFTANCMHETYST